MTLEDELREGGQFGDGCTCVQCRAADRIRTLEAALRELVDDIEDRFDMESSSTNPGMRVAVSQARAALAPTATEGRSKCGSPE